MLPETEQRSLEDIELHFSDNNRSITDINIRIYPRAGDAENAQNANKDRY